MEAEMADLLDVQAKRAVRVALPIHPALVRVERNADGYFAHFHNLFFIVSTARENDGKVWLHASVSRRDRKLPTWDDLMGLKHYCIGDDQKAILVLPPRSSYVNLAQVLHLFSCLGPDGDGLPEFSWKGVSL